MTLPPKEKRCVYCLQTFDQLTWDHIPAQAWYAKTSKINTEKWKVPACKTCNKKLGEIEESLLIDIGLCLDPENLKSHGISNKILSSMDTIAKNDKDRIHRNARGEKKLHQIEIVDSLKNLRVLSGFNNSNYWNCKYPIIKIQPEKTRYHNRENN